MYKRKESSTNQQNRQALQDFCGMVYAHDMISGRWKMLILYKLANAPLRYGQLRDKLPNITERMLTLQLKELERDKLVARTVYPEVPARVEYTLTASAQVLRPIWLALEEWGNQHRTEMDKDANAL